MGVRRFVNLLTKSRERCMTSLRRFDLSSSTPRRKSSRHTADAKKQRTGISPETESGQRQEEEAEEPAIGLGGPPDPAAALIVSLGSGRFCILRFLETRIPSLDPELVLVGKSYAVFTGLEVLPGKGKHGIRMVSHSQVQTLQES